MINRSPEADQLPYSVSPVSKTIQQNRLDDHYPTAFTRHSYRIIQNKKTIIDLRGKSSSSRTHLNKILKQIFIDQNMDNIIKIINETDKDKKYKLQQQLNKRLINFMMRNFTQYLTEYQHSTRLIRLKHKETGEYLSIPLETRYSNSYKKKIKKRMDWLAYHYRRSNALLLTLTFDPKKYDYSLIKMNEAVKKELNRLMTNLRRIFCYEKVYHNYIDENGKMRRKIAYEKYREFPKYITTIESMKGREENEYIGKGIPHIHIAFIGATRLMDWRRIRHLWKNGHVWINRTKTNGKVRKPIDYVAKYITKSYCGEEAKNEGMLLSRSLTWFYGLRSFSCSRGLIYPLKGIPSGMYDAVYLLEYAKEVSLKELAEDLQKYDIMFLGHAMSKEAG